MRLRGRGFFIGVVCLACCGVLGYAAAGFAASGLDAGAPPLSADALAAIQANVRSALTLEGRAIKDLKKRNSKAIAESRVAMRQAGTALSTALESLMADGFRTSTAYDSVARARNGLKGALASHLLTDTVKYLKAAIPYENKALAELPSLAVAPTTSAQAPSTSTQTTTGG